MASVSALWKTIKSSILTSPRQSPSVVTIPNSHIEPQADLEEPFDDGNDYFEVRINQMFLREDRKWLTQIDPMVFVVSEFDYDGTRQTIPFVVGPALLQQFGQPLPQGMVISNRTVAGLHPYRGGTLTLSVVLSQIPVNDLARKFLGFLEQAAGALDFATALGAYVKVGSVILDGVDALFGLNGTLPLIAQQNTFHPGPSFTPGYLALIDTPDLNPESLWVRRDQLLHGPDAASAVPYRAADFVLYSVVRAPERKRTDVERLPFFEIWKRVKAEAAGTKPDNWENAKVNMSTLYQAMVVSPDLTDNQADELRAEYAARMVRIHEGALENVKHGELDAAPDPMAGVRNKALEILKL